MSGQETGAVFVTAVDSVELEPRVRRAIAGLREFGGALASCPVLVFAPGSLLGTGVGRMEGVDVLALEVEPELARYPFGAKVAAGAGAETRVRGSARSLVWLGPDCLVVNPPEQFALGPDRDVAFRPVHIANIGSRRSEPMDEYWRAVYAAVGAQDDDQFVESLLDRQRLRPYYNTHCFSVNPGLGLMAAWLDAFRSLVAAAVFQSGPCRDELHHIFLHQVVLNALVTRLVAPGRVRLLPPSYSYPLHFHARLAVEQRARAMNDVRVAAYEDDSDLAALPADAHFQSWLRKH